VLCVDDDEDWSTLLAIVLRRHGAVVTTLSSAEAAIACLAGNVFDVVVSDISMPPGLDGYDLAHALRELEQKDPARLATPAVALSGDAARPSTKKRFADFQVYMSKTFDEGRLVDVVARLAEADSEAVKDGTLAAWEAKRGTAR
jgi:two-component system response regulator FlrC